MAILTSFKVPGDPQDLARRGMEQIEPEISQVAARNGAIARIIVDDGDGLRFFHLWEGEEGMRKTAEEMSEKIGELDFPQQEDWNQYEVVHHVVQGS